MEQAEVQLHARVVVYLPARPPSIVSRWQTMLPCLPSVIHQAVLPALALKWQSSDSTASAVGGGGVGRRMIGSQASRAACGR